MNETTKIQKAIETLKPYSKIERKDNKLIITFGDDILSEYLTIDEEMNQWRNKVVKKTKDYLKNLDADKLERVVYGRDTLEFTIEGNYFNLKRIERGEKDYCWFFLLIFFTGIFLGIIIGLFK